MRESHYEGLGLYFRKLRRKEALKLLEVIEFGPRSRATLVFRNVHVIATRNRVHDELVSPTDHRLPSAS